MIFHPVRTVRAILLSCSIFTAVISPVSLAWQAQELATPMPTTNRHHIAELFGAPTAVAPIPEGASGLRWEWATEIINTSNDGITDNEFILQDGETVRGNLGLTLDAAGGYSWRLDLPYLSHSGGSLDPLIESFHDIGFPNGNRDERPKDEILFLYERDGEVLLDFDGGAGIGDMSLSVQRTWQTLDPGNDENISYAWRAGVNLPTGDEDSLTGSDTTDLFVEVMRTGYITDESGSMGTFVRLGAQLFIGDGVLEEIREDWSIYTSLGLQLAATKNMAIKLQFDGHTALFDSELKELGETAGTLLLGTTFKAGKRTRVDFYISEDIIVDTSPDVVFGLHIRRQ